VQISAYGPADATAVLLLGAVRILHQKKRKFCARNLQILCTIYMNSVQILRTSSSQFFYGRPM